MKHFVTVPEVDTAVMQACARFLTQARPVLSLDSLAVVLLEPDGNSSRVVFSWGAAHQFDTATLPPVTSQFPSYTGDRHSLCLPLEGRQGALGAVFCSSECLDGFDLVEQGCVRPWAQDLALELENIRLQYLLERNTAENRVFERIADIVSSDAPDDRIYRRFASEIKPLVDYQSLSFYLADQDAGLLTCAYRMGRGVSQLQSGEIRKWKGTYCELAISRGQGFVVEDDPDAAAVKSLELSDAGRLRSAIVVPINYAGKAMGALVAQNRRPNAYGPSEQRLLQRAATLLGPRIANSSVFSQPQRKARGLVLLDDVSWIMGSNRHLEEGFGHLAAAVNKLIPFDLVTLSWMNPGGHDIRTLRWCAFSGDSEDILQGQSFFSIQCQVLFWKRIIGTLTVLRANGGPFTAQEQDVLQGAIEVIVLGRPGTVAWSEDEVECLRALATESTDGIPTPLILRALEADEAHRPLGSLRREQLVDLPHSLRSLLAAIKGYVSALLQSDVKWPPELHREFLETIDREADRMNQVVTDMLEATQGEARALPPI